MFFDKNLKLLRRNNNMSQEELADLLQYSFRNISKWETGQAVPTYEVLIEIANIFNITVRELVEEDLSFKNIAKYKSSILSNEKNYIDFQKELFKYMYSEETVSQEREIKLVDGNLIFKDFNLSTKLIKLLNIEKLTLDKTEYLLDSTLKKLKFNGFVSYFKIIKNDNTFKIIYEF